MKEINRRFNLKSNDVKSFPKKNTLQAAEILMGGNLYVDPWFESFMTYELKSFDWNVKYSKAPTTHQLYLQGLTPVAYLTGAFVLEQRKEYLALASEFISSWNAFQKTKESKENEYIWDHHGVAIRAESILYFALICQEYNYKFIDEEVINDILEQHAVWLSDNENYLSGTNHGVFENKALLYLGYALSNRSMIEIAKKRTYEESKVLFTSEGITTENSFNYQRINKELFFEIGEILSKNSDPLGEELIKLTSKAEDFMGYAIKPNRYCSTFGDTMIAYYGDCFTINPNGVLAYASSQAKKNIPKLPPKMVSYPISGYFIGREFWSSKDKSFSDATWTLFKCGYSNIVHKQADDNSFSLYSRGHDIFVDCGMYNYMFRDPVRHYLRTANAHNTVIVDESSFEFQRNALCDRCGIIHSDINEKYGYVVGYNYLYLGVYMLRHFVFAYNKIFIIDKIESNTSHKYTQLFHLSNDLTIKFLSKNKLVADIGNNPDCSKVSVSQMNNGTDIELIYGGDVARKNEQSYGIMSEEFNSFFNINTVKFNANAKDFVYLTSISIGEEDNKDAFNYNSNTNILSIYESDKCIELKILQENELNIKCKKKIPLDNCSIENDNDVITVKDNDNYNEDVSYAWYVVDEDTREKIFIQMYKKDKYFKFDLNTSNSQRIHIRVFLLNELTNFKCSQIVAHFKKTNGEWVMRKELGIDPSVLLY